MDKSETDPIVIEFTGVTGVGKTTLINLVKENLLEQGFHAKYAEEFVLEFYSLNFVSQPIVRSILIDLLTFVPFISFMGSRRGRELIRLGIKIILRDSDSFLNRVNLLRNFAKRIGIYVFLQDSKNRQKNNINCDFILCDEGLLQTAHNLFVHVNSVPNIREIEDFKNLVPQPQIIVWIKANPEKSIQCTLTRGHRRVKKDINLVKQFVDNACLTFECLFSDKIINTNFLVVDNSSGNIFKKDNKYLEQQIIQIIDLVKKNRQKALTKLDKHSR